MALVFNGLELGAIVLAILIANQVTQEGESTWFEGLQLLAVYVVLGARLLLRLMPSSLAFFTGPVPWLVLAVVTVVCLWVDLHFFARGREPSFREGVVWSIGWLVVLAARRASSCWCSPTPTTRSPTRPSTSSSARCRSTTCSSSCCCSRTSAMPGGATARGCCSGASSAALVLRGLAILGGVALIEQFHFVIYVLGVLLLVLAYRILQGVDENVDPDKNFIVRLRAPVLPGDARRPRRPLVRDDRRHSATSRRSSSAWRRSSRPTSPSRSTRSRPPSRSRATPC